MGKESKQNLDDIDNWADCSIAGCAAKCCVGISSIYCFPHSCEYLNILPHFFDADHWRRLRECQEKRLVNNQPQMDDRFMQSPQSFS